MAIPAVRHAGISPANSDSTGWKPVGRDRQDACLPVASAVPLMNLRSLGGHAVIFHHPPVEEMNGAISVLRETDVVRDHANSGAGGV